MQGRVVEAKEWQEAMARHGAPPAADGGGDGVTGSAVASHVPELQMRNAGRPVRKDTYHSTGRCVLGEIGRAFGAYGRYYW